MSRGARWLLGSFASLFALIFVYTIPVSKAPWLTGGLVAFCLAIAVACFSRKGRGLALRLVGISVFLAYMFYFVWEILTGFNKPYTGSGQEHWINALIGMFTFGLPGVYVSLKGIYPKWGLRSDVFRGNNDSSSSTAASESHSVRTHRP